ncbi:MAG: 50S ribosomal protein L17 [Lachnospiraceae bacterium]|nr:50S ribosomal protein L17 [Lachnospiraceae bacterium]
MSGYRKLSRNASQRKALLRNQVTNLLYYGKIITTEAKAKEIRKIAEKMIALGVKECNNYDTVTVKTKTPRLDKDGRRVKEEVDGKKVDVFDEVDKEIRKDQPSRLHARRQMNKFLYVLKDVPVDVKGRRKGTKKVDVSSIVLDELGPKYAERNGEGGYTRIVKIGQRKGDAAMQVLIELV